MEQTLKLYSRAGNVSRLGPGKRYVLWTQGCPFRCEGCITPDSQPLDGGEIVKVVDIICELKKHPDIEGITISGGEPFLQSAALSVLAKWCSDQGLGVIVFSGYTLAQLQRKKNAQSSSAEFLAYIDVLVDGLYIADENKDTGFRGSQNQEFHFLTDRYKGDLNYFNDYSKLQFEVTEGAGSTMFVGIPGAQIQSIWTSEEAQSSRSGLDEWTKKYDDYCKSQ